MIEFKNLSYSIDSTAILKDIDFRIADNEFVAIIGPNGAGKSTLIKLLLALLEPSSGEILIDAIPNHKWLKMNSIGYLPQKEIYDRHFPATALDIVLMGLAASLPLGKRFRQAHRNIAEAALEQCGVLKHRNSLIGTLSGGEFQRVLLARAIVSGSHYLILDEPEAGIDQKGVEGFFTILKDLHVAGKTIITISHDLHTLSKYCSFLVCLNVTLHCHSKTELLNSEVIHKTFGDTIQLVDKHY
ncbi:MAG: metal ABC transporter ATP-binding protein [Candidatus Cloacimonetes bacterium]|nr:metal ABC transporter ATP-binding protein [Candidatus Cloacimonadota bacterium]